VTKPFEPRELVARVDAQFRSRELAVRVQRAEQLSSLGILTAGLAHELRNPANGIVNAVAPLTELLPAELTRPETPVGQLLAVMAGCSEQIAFLSRQLLGFRRGSADIDRRPTKVADLVNRAVSLAQSALAGVELRNRVELTCEVWCAAPLLVQALTNLVENAGHAAGAGGWVEIRAAQDAGRITIEVADSGRGVPVELRERVFEPFFTTKAPGSGTGLGLSVARAIVHRHQGLLEIRERGGRPAFVIELPIEASNASLVKTG
jgi:two-component system sensor histidine kinase HydH